jgi:hypothetical protein
MSAAAAILIIAVMYFIDKHNRWKTGLYKVDLGVTKPRKRFLALICFR